MHNVCYIFFNSCLYIQDARHLKKKLEWVLSLVNIVICKHVDAIDELSKADN